MAVSRITGRLAAVFRRSHGDNHPAASAVAARHSTPVPLPRAAAPLPVPRSPALVVADAYVVANGTRFASVARSEEFVAVVPTQQRIALRLPTTEYRTVMGELLRWFNAEYDEASPEYRAFRYAALACAGCGWEFPGSYRHSLLGMLDGAKVVGARSGFAKFGRTGKCPRCGSRDSFLLYECIDPAEIDEQDLVALIVLYRDDALRWWSHTGRKMAICDSCNRDIQAGEGYLVSLSHLKCEPCLRKYLDGSLEKLRANPYHYGATELRRARPFRTGGALAEGGAYGVEHVLVLWDGTQPDAVELKDLVESVAPGSTAQGMYLGTTDSPALSRGLAYWHVHSDEVAGRLTAGAWRRTRLALREGGSDRGRRLVAVVAAAAPNAEESAPARQEWAREMIFRHVARVELELRPDLMDRPTWCRLLNPEVFDFVLDIDPGATDAVPSTAYPFRAQTFGDFSVLVSLFDVAQADRIRDLMAGGWESYLDELLHATGIRLGERDLAHWILGREPGGGATVVSLAYLPAAADSAPLVPVDLLAPARPDTPW